MKKLGKVFATLAAVAMLGTGFFSCSGDDGGNGGGGDGLAAGGVYSTLTAEKKATTAPSTAGTITVSGGASYSGTDINAAWTAVQSATADVTMTLAAGSYEATSQLSYSGSHNVKISGDPSAEYGTNVLIHGNLGTNSQKARELLYMTSSSKGNLTLEYITIKNDFAMTSTSDVQAEAVATDGTGNLAAYNCSFLSGQDTIRTVAKAWFYKCYIEGDVDFLWMETSGTVALYEECVIRAIADRVQNAYITAPRAALTTKVGKGLVIYNSTIEAEGGLGSNFFLGRNPWSGSSFTSYYNQVAVVDSPLYLGEGVSLNATIWKSDSNGTKDKQYVGFKTDDYYAAPSKTYGTRLSTNVESAEYCGRRGIINRIYNISSKKFTKDFDSEWDIDTLISDNSWTVTTDTSFALLSGESELTSVTYDFTSSSANGYTDATVSNFAVHSSGSATGGSGATITVPVTGKCVVYVTGFYSGYGTIQAGNQGEAIYDLNNNTTNSTLEKAYVVYDATATSVVITALTSSYITKVVVENDASLSYTAVKGISVAASSSTYTVGVPVTLTATVTPDSATNADVKWSSSDETIGTVNEITGVATFVAAGNVTFTATARDGSGKKGTIKCTPEAATWTSAEWYDTTDKSSTTTSGNGTGLGEAAGAYHSVFTIGTGSGVTLGGAKTVELINGTTVSISTGIKMNSSGTVTFSVTEAAKVTVLTGYCSDANATSDTLAITASNGGVATAWNSNPTSIPSADATYIWSLTAGTYKLARGGAGYAPAIYYVRVDIGEFEDTSSTTAVTAISVTDADEGTSSSIPTGGVVQLTAAVTPSNATDSTVTWSSSDETKATVSSSGLVTGVSAGTVTITATANDGSGVTGSYEVTVTSETVSTVIENCTIIRFGSSGNYATVTQLDLSNITVSDNGGNNSQIKEGYMTFDVLAGAKVTVNGYSGYTSYTLGDGTTTSDTITDSAYTYTATSDCTITITPQSSNNYFYNIIVAYTLDSATTITFGSGGNYKNYVDLTKITVGDNGADNSQVKEGYFTFDVASGATVTVKGYPSYTSYTFGDGTTISDTITDSSYTYTAAADCTITITPVNSNNYLYSVSVIYN